jgi:hypothetical protein
MSSDNQFTATGKAEIGFQTNSSSIRIGADIAGNEFGVKGHCENGPGIFGESTNNVGVKATSTFSEAVQGTGNIGVSGTGTPGVFGHGVFGQNGATRHNGVLGVVEGDEGAGVFGGHRKLDALKALRVTSFDPAASPGAGVFGVSTDDANGVVGKSQEGHGVVGTSEGGVDFKNHGVFGRSTQTAGVAGISGGEAEHHQEKFKDAFGGVGRAGVFGFSARGTGVFGSSIEPFTHGVRGSSVDGNGVLGTSKHGRGGVFTSGEREGAPLVPQLQLTPQLMVVPGSRDAKPQMFIPSAKALPELPQAGQGGDLLVTQDKNHFCTLWFCVQGKEGNNLAKWSQVLLGDPVQRKP